MSIVHVHCRGGSPSEADTTKGKYGLVSGQEITILKDDGTTKGAVVIGVGGWPNKFGIPKLWVKEDDGDFSFIESEKDFVTQAQVEQDVLTYVARM